ncbi:MAG: alpha/beta fold hydrolase [Hyphomonas sp.]
MNGFRAADGINSLEYLTAGDPDGRPLVVLNSMEYPGWPPAEFCHLAAAAGFRTISIRRPGFGRNPSLPDAQQQAQLVADFLSAEGLCDAVLVALGTANPVAYRLARMCPDISFVVFANCAFNFDHISGFRPEWFVRALEQALQSPAGARLSLMGLKSSWGVFGRTWVHENILQKSPGDLGFLNDHPELVDDAIRGLIRDLDVKTFMLEVAGSLNDDPVLTDDCFGEVRALLVSGRETTPFWQEGIEREAHRVGVPVAYLPSGDMMCVYRSPVEFFAVLREHV